MIDFEKGNGLVPAIIQHAHNMQVLMLGYMNADAFEKTKEIKKVTFYSRSKNRLWTKGEESGNFLDYISHSIDCDKDTILIKASPAGPTCHKGTDTCFGDCEEKGFVQELDAVIANRKEMPESGSYTNSLFEKGINKIAQKVGEEAVETIIEATNGTEEKLIEESADLVYHLLVLLNSKALKFSDVESVLKKRHYENS